MDDDVKLLERIYDRFNARDIDGVLTVLTDDVVWANGMDGGHVHGREAVREYWARQWTMKNRIYGGFHRSTNISFFYCNLQDKECHSETEWEALVKAYIE